VHRLLFALVAFLSFWSAAASAQEAAKPLDGPNRIFQDELLDHMTGAWKAMGTIGRQNVSHTVEASWVLNHQFLQIHEQAMPAPGDKAPAYEAIVMIGYDNASERYVAHWNDIYGGRFSETLGYGTKSGDQIEFVFEYPDGPFHTTFRWLAEKNQWQWRMRTKNQAGQWVDFANFTLARTP
jgi:hypothetical protein